MTDYFLSQTNRICAAAALCLTTAFMPAAAQPAPMQSSSSLMNIDKQVIRDIVRQMEAEDRARAEKQSRTPVFPGRRSCQKYDRRSAISYTSDDDTFKTGLRLRRNQVSLEFRYTLDADVARNNPGKSGACGDISNWQGWGPIIYREATGDRQGNFTRQEILRQTQDDYRQQQMRGVVPDKISP